VGCLKNKQDGVLMKVEKELMTLKDVHEQLAEKSQDDQVLFHWKFLEFDNLSLKIICVTISSR
jgi:hypothetical protein